MDVSTSDIFGVALLCFGVLLRFVFSYFSFETEFRRSFECLTFGGGRREARVVVIGSRHCGFCCSFRLL